MKLFNWLFGDHSNCVSMQEHEALKESLMKEADARLEIAKEGHRYQSAFHKLSLECSEKSANLERLKKELETCQQQEERYKQIIETLQLQIKTLQSQIVLLQQKEVSHEHT